MRVDIRNMLRQSADMLGKRRLDEREKMVVGMYQLSLNELSRNLEELARGDVTFDEFCDHYCLNRAQQKPITSIVPTQSPTTITKGPLGVKVP